jgi:hypothetical protein
MSATTSVGLALWQNTRIAGEGVDIRNNSTSGKQLLDRDPIDLAIMVVDCAHCNWRSTDN